MISNNGKGNPNHDENGRFTSGGNASSKKENYDANWEKAKNLYNGKPADEQGNDKKGSFFNPGGYDDYTENYETKEQDGKYFAREKGDEEWTEIGDQRYDQLAKKGAWAKNDGDWNRAQQLYSGGIPTKDFSDKTKSHSAKFHLMGISNIESRLKNAKARFYDYSKIKELYDKYKKSYKDSKENSASDFSPEDIKYIDNKFSSLDDSLEKFRTSIKPSTSTYPMQEPEGATNGWWQEDWDDVVGEDNDDMHWFQDRIMEIDDAGRRLDSYEDSELYDLKDTIEDFLEDTDQDKFKIATQRAKDVLYDIEDRLNG